MADKATAINPCIPSEPALLAVRDEEPRLEDVLIESSRLSAGVDGMKIEHASLAAGELGILTDKAKRDRNVGWWGVYKGRGN